MVRVEGSPCVQQLHIWQIFCILVYDHRFLYNFTRIQVKYTICSNHRLNLKGLILSDKVQTTKLLINVSLCLTRRWRWDLNSNYCSERKGFKFMMTFNVLPTVQYTTGITSQCIESRIEGLMKTPSLKGIRRTKAGGQWSFHVLATVFGKGVAIPYLLTGWTQWSRQKSLSLPENKPRSLGGRSARSLSPYT